MKYIVDIQNAGMFFITTNTIIVDIHFNITQACQKWVFAFYKLSPSIIDPYFLLNHFCFSFVLYLEMRVNIITGTQKESGRSTMVIRDCKQSPEQSVSKERACIPMITERKAVQNYWITNRRQKFHSNFNLRQSANHFSLQKRAGNAKSIWKTNILRTTGNINREVVPMFLRAFIDDIPHESKYQLIGSSLASSNFSKPLRIFSDYKISKQTKSSRIFMTFLVNPGILIAIMDKMSNSLMSLSFPHRYANRPGLENEFEMKGLQQNVND
ncbi:hypothetical protein FGO68_gene5140 [Halteria grandinella]|uniref:Uncharacterized protein n=1 Tax=Halteria grandinella TaxID=5974 RepID=A0A8J8P603_HALGN|nr:hypothetical protein FGO68_gene5140 [Halteria grandinella]